MIHVVFITFIFLILSVIAQEDCLPRRCHASGPIIRFPFRLKGFHPQHCGYPGFDVSCNLHNTIEFDFQYPVQFLTRTQTIVLPISAKATIDQIDYKTQVIQISNLSLSCFPDQVPTVNATATYLFDNVNEFTRSNLSIFSCTGPMDQNEFSPSLKSCSGNGLLDNFRSGDSITYAWQRGCVKMYTISSPYYGALRDRTLSSLYFGATLYWSKPYCEDCEQRGMYCRSNTTTNSNRETECIANQRDAAVVKRVIVGSSVAGSLLVAAAFAYAKSREKHGILADIIL